MNIFNDTVCKIQTFFPKVQVKYKDESLFMKILGIILFFNPSFSKHFITTIGNTIYFPSRAGVEASQISYSAVLLHEMTHVYDSQKQNKILFSLLYLMPQLLSLLTLPLCLIFGWSGILALIFILPFPAYWRMKSEMKGYTISLYVNYKYHQKGLYNDDLEKSKNFFAREFKSASYYFVWPFSSIDIHFDQALKEIEAGNKPFYEKELYDIVDQVIG